MSKPLAQGLIAWTAIPDSEGGNIKVRPVVILTKTEEIKINGNVKVAAITTDCGRAPFSETVELPFSEPIHPLTKLNKPGEVVCSWVAEVPCARLYSSGGSLPEDVLREVLLKVQRFS